MNTIYLIPANTKKGQLIFNIFNTTDLIIFGVGLGASFILLLVFGAAEILNTIIVLFPALFSAFLVLPVPNYHNVRTFFKSLFSFLRNQRIYMWKGWCMYDTNKE